VTPLASPDVTVLAVHKGLQAEGGGAPVVVVGRAGSGRTLAVTAGPTWQWGFDERLRSTYSRFWGQAIRFLAGEEENSSGPGVSVRLDKGEAIYRQGEPVTVFATVRGAGGSLTAFADVEARVAGADPGGKPQKLRLSPTPGRPGEFEATFTPSFSGRHHLTVSARARAEVASEEYGAAELKFEVEGSGVEDQRFDIDEETLKAIAAVSGGQHVPLPNLGELLTTLRARQSERRHAVTIRFWNAPAFFIVLVAAAGLEWFVRRRMQLA
jgi:hypothetical protein